MGIYVIISEVIRMSKILILLMAVLMLAGCSIMEKESALKALRVVPTGIVVEAQDNNLFDARKMNVGDRVCGMRITEIELGGETSSNYTGTVAFTGEIIVSGTYKHNNEDEFLGHEISFEVDKEYSSILPKFTHDERTVWFVFDNYSEAEKLFGPPGSEGKAIVVIDDYTLRYAPTETWNSARLIKVFKD